MDIKHSNLPTEKIVQVILKALPQVNKIFVFGSRARGDNLNPRADIDVGICAPQKLDLAQMARVEMALEEIDTLLSTDLVDFTGRDDDLSREALRDKVVIYEKG